MVTVCDDARERCPVLPGAKRQLHRSFPDPARTTGPADQIRAAFRSARDQLAAFATDLRADLTGEPPIVARCQVAASERNRASIGGER